jgi:uncharacterized protein
MTDQHIQYPVLIDQAMRGIVRDVLRRISAGGLPGEHHFYVSFDTAFPGVRMSETLKSRYPKEITIVLQHQFWDFKVEEAQFQVTLSFSGVPEKLVVPFAALTAFADPSVKFGLQFQNMSLADVMLTDVQDISAHALPQENNGVAASAEIISLESFRKK